MITVFDIETTFQLDKEGKKDASPKNPLNRIVSIGINEEYFFLYHTEKFEQDPNLKEKIQDILDKTTLLVAHNIKFDLMWLYEAGFTYTGKGGHVNIQASVTATGTTPTQTNYDFLIYKNGVAVPTAVFSRTFNNTASGSVSIVWQEDLETDDYLELFVQNAENTNDLDINTIKLGING